MYSSDSAERPCARRKGRSYLTDASNASRTQLYNLREQCWDTYLCRAFGLDAELLPQVVDSNAEFGETDFEGLLPRPVPIRAVMGDSHAALYGQGCHRPGTVKATYGTGSSVMMNTGKDICSDNALSSSVAFQINGETTYCLEGNINYSGAIMTWLKEDLGLVQTLKQAEELAAGANPLDKAVIVPAFTGLSAPYWNSEVRAAVLNMSRTTGRAELVRAATNSIAHQVADVLDQMKSVYGSDIPELRVDGGPTANIYLMQFQSDMSGSVLLVPERQELSAIGTAYLAGITLGVMDQELLFDYKSRRVYRPQMERAAREEHRLRWRWAVETVLNGPLQRK